MLGLVPLYSVTHHDLPVKLAQEAVPLSSCLPPAVESGSYRPSATMIALPWSPSLCPAYLASPIPRGNGGKSVSQLPKPVQMDDCANVK